MATSIQSRKPGSAGNLLVFFGYFMLFCAFLMLIAAAWRTYRTHIVNTRWVETPAQVQKCSLRLYHPSTRGGGGVVYSLFCRLSYEFASRDYEFRLWTTSDRSEAVRSSVLHWIPQHRPGTALIVRVNPSNPNEISVESELPIHQFNTAREALLSAIVFGFPGLLFIPIGRKLTQ
jgi:Protein of unknown function (DUF3592)